MDTLLLIPAALVGYLLGSIPSGVLLARLFGWPDPRTHGSTHTGGLNTFRGAGLWAGALVAALDIAKGIAAVLLASLISPSPWAITLGGIGAVAGHNWPVWLGFSGGMGLATGAGATAVFSPLGVLITGAAWGVARLVVRHTPRATIAAALTVPLTLWLLSVDPPVFWLGTGCSMIIAGRHLIDWNREYR